MLSFYTFRVHGGVHRAVVGRLQPPLLLHGICRLYLQDSGLAYARIGEPGKRTGREVGNDQECNVAVRIRLKRVGRRNRPSYRVAAMDSRRARDSRVIEELGSYDPLDSDESRQVVLKRDRIEYWLSVGAKPSDTVRQLLRKQSIGVEESEA